MRILLVSHGNLASGMADVINNFLGNGNEPVLAADVTLDGGVDDLMAGVRGFLAGCKDGEQVIICSDLLGGSANQSVYPIVLQRPNTLLVAGMNLPLVLQLSLIDGDITIDGLRDVIRQSREGITLVNDMEFSARDDDE